jgi:hypothetical protein
MTLTYAILMTLSTLGSIYNSIQTPVYWYSSILNLLITILAYAYARDLNIIRNQRFATPIFVSPSQPQTVVHMAPGQQYTSSSGGWQPPPAYNSGPYKPYN